jgi:hypothetical protein
MREQGEEEEEGSPEVWALVVGYNKNRGASAG